MADLYSSALENLEKTFMPYLSEYQRYIDFHTMRKMKQVIKDKRSVYFDLNIKETADMKTRTIMDVWWDEVLITAVIPSTNTFRTTIEIYGKPPKMLIARLELDEERKAFIPSYMKEEFARRKALRDILSEFSMKLFTHLNSYIGEGDASTDENPFSEFPDAERFESWEFAFLEQHPDLQQEWLTLKKRTAKQYKRIEELEIEDKFALETMVDKDVPTFIESFQKLSDENKEKKKDELLETMSDLKIFIEKLERKEEEVYSRSFDKSKGVITSKYNKNSQDDEDDLF